MNQKKYTYTDNDLGKTCEVTVLGITLSTVMEDLQGNIKYERAADFDPKALLRLFVKECVQNAISLGWIRKREMECLN